MLFLIPHINYQTMSEWTIKTKKDEKRDKTRQDNNNNNTTNTQELETTTRRLKIDKFELMIP